MVLPALQQLRLMCSRGQRRAPRKTGRPGRYSQGSSHRRPSTLRSCARTAAPDRFHYDPQCREEGREPGFLEHALAQQRPQVVSTGSWEYGLLGSGPCRCPQVEMRTQQEWQSPKSNMNAVPIPRAGVGPEGQGPQREAWAGVAQVQAKEQGWLLRGPQAGHPAMCLLGNRF